MRTKELKQIVLPPISADKLAQFDITGTFGRDEIAEQIVRDIDYWCQVQYSDERRSHLGASIMGHACSRFIWFGFRWMFHEVHSGQQQRLFQRGHLEEERIVEWLTGIGFEIKTVDVDGKQFKILFASGQGAGSSDAIGKLPTRYGNFEPILLEFKTQKDK